MLATNTRASAGSGSRASSRSDNDSYRGADLSPRPLIPETNSRRDSLAASFIRAGTVLSLAGLDLCRGNTPAFSSPDLAVPVQNWGRFFFAGDPARFLQFLRKIPDLKRLPT
jgi:hypothetical protein